MTKNVALAWCTSSASRTSRVWIGSGPVVERQHHAGSAAGSANDRVGKHPEAQHEHAAEEERDVDDGRRVTANGSGGGSARNDRAVSPIPASVAAQKTILAGGTVSSLGLSGSSSSRTRARRPLRPRRPRRRRRRGPSCRRPSSRSPTPARVVLLLAVSARRIVDLVEAREHGGDDRQRRSGQAAERPLAGLQHRESRCTLAHVRSANIPPSARRTPKKALRPASIFPSADQMGLPATRPVITPVAAAARYANDRVREERHAQALHEHGRHDRTDDGAEDEADDQALQHLGSTGVYSPTPSPQVTARTRAASFVARPRSAEATPSPSFGESAIRSARGSATSTTSRLPRVTAV